MYQWHVLTIGHLSRNKFWGEDEQQGYRSPLCTCTLLQGNGLNIVIDPSQPTEQMAESLFNNSGLKPEAIDYVYCTHYHYDHQVELKTFPNAKWCMPRIDLEELHNNFEQIAGIWTALTSEQVDRMVPPEDNLAPGLTMVPLPGHTEGLNGYLFDAPEGKVICTGDSVMTQEFYHARESYFFGWNMEKAIASIHSLRGKADIIVPGHGQAFVEKAF